MNQLILLITVLALCIPGHAQYSSATGVNGLDTEELLWGHRINREEFPQNSPRLRDNSWAAALVPQFEKTPDELIATFSSDPETISEAWDQCTENMSDLILGYTRINHRDRSNHRVGEFGLNSTYPMEKVNIGLRCTMQTLLNKVFVHGEQMKNHMDARNYSAFWTYVIENNLQAVAIHNTMFVALGVEPLTQAEMQSFYSAGHERHSEIISDLRAGGEPYEGREWESARETMRRANRNFNSNNTRSIPQHPNYGYFNSRTPPQDTFDQLTPYLRLAAVAVVSWGIGTAASGVAQSLVGAETAASGALVTQGGTTLVTSGGQTTLAGATLNVAAGATSGALVGTMQGQNFGDALLTGVTGGAVGAAVGTAAGNGLSLDGSTEIFGGLNINSTVNNVVNNQLVSDYVTAVAVGTTSGAILNGGDIDSAFSGAATSAAFNTLQNAATRPREPTPEQQAQLDRIQGQTAHAGSTVEVISQNRINQAITGHENQATGAINFSMAQQSQAIWNAIENNSHQQSENRIRDIASEQLDRDEYISDFNDDLQSQLVSNQAQMDARPTVPTSTVVDYVIPNMTGSSLIIGGDSVSTPNLIEQAVGPFIAGTSENLSENWAQYILGRAWSSTVNDTVGRLTQNALRLPVGISGALSRNMTGEEATAVTALMVAAEAGDRSLDLFNNGGRLVAEASSNSSRLSAIGRNAIRFAGGGPVQVLTLTAITMTESNLRSGVEFSANNPDIPDRFNPYFCGACGL